MGGTPVFFGTRVPIKNLFDYWETGESIKTFLENFDGVSKSQVIRLLEMSQKLIETSTHIRNENFAWWVRYQTIKAASARIRGLYEVEELVSFLPSYWSQVGNLERNKAYIIEK